jgi:hypothetical protein
MAQFLQKDPMKGKVRPQQCVPSTMFPRQRTQFGSPGRKTAVIGCQRSPVDRHILVLARLAVDQPQITTQSGIKLLRCEQMEQHHFMPTRRKRRQPARKPGTS